MKDGKNILEQLIEHEIKEYDAQILNEQLLSALGNAVKSFFQKVGQFFSSIAGNVKFAYDVFIKDWNALKDNYPEFYQIVSKETNIDDFNDIKEEAPELIDDYLKSETVLTPEVQSVLLEVLDNNFSFFEDSKNSIENATNQQQINQMLIRFDGFLGNLEDFTESFAQDTEDMKQRLENFQVERLLTLLLQSKEQGSLTEEVALESLEYMKKYIQLQLMFQSFQLIAEAIQKVQENIEALLDIANERFSELSQDPTQSAPEDTGEQDGNVQQQNREAAQSNDGGPVSREIGQILSQ